MGWGKQQRNIRAENTLIYGTIERIYTKYLKMLNVVNMKTGVIEVCDTQFIQ